MIIIKRCHSCLHTFFTVFIKIEIQNLSLDGEHDSTVSWMKSAVKSGLILHIWMCSSKILPCQLLPGIHFWAQSHYFMKPRCFYIIQVVSLIFFLFDYYVLFYRCSPVWNYFYGNYCLCLAHKTMSFNNLCLSAVAEQITI